VDYAARSWKSFDTRPFLEDVMTISHDLLTFTNTPQPDVNQAQAIAALFFLQILLRSRSLSFTACEIISSRLRASLEDYDMAQYRSPLPFWALFMGGLASTETSDNAWFRRKLRKTLSVRGDMVIWQDVKRELQKVIWLDSLQDKHGQALWKEVAPNNIPVSMDTLVNQS
jgi:hypothetical protein